MAELINLQEADRFVRELQVRMEQLKKQLDNSRGTVWSDQQLEQLYGLFNAVSNLSNVLISTIHNNRDGRGTPPAKGTINSMLDRTR